MRVFKSKKTKKAGFSLMELAIAVMIVALLTVIIIPIVQNQLAKSDEYAYYMAYRNVEKLGGQIVALGDPDDSMYKTQLDDSLKFANKNENRFLASLKSTFSNLGARFAYTEHYVFKNLFPKSFADDWTNFSSISSDDYEYTQEAFLICNNRKKIINRETPKKADGSDNYYTCKTYLCGEDVSGSTPTPCEEEKFYKLDDDSLDTLSSFIPAEGCFLGYDDENVRSAERKNLKKSIRNHMLNNGSFANFCGLLRTPCKGENTPKEYRIADSIRTETTEDVDDETGETTRETVSYCDSQSRLIDGVSGSSGSSDYLAVTPPSIPNICKKAPYYGMRNANEVHADEDTSQSINCVCKIGTVTANNDKVCCPTLSGYNSYAPTTVSAAATTKYNNYANTTAVAYKTNPEYCRYCIGEYNPVNDWCCPEHSVFNGTACECANGYKMEKPGTSAEYCKKTKCAEGYHTDEETEVCVPNPPIIKGKRLCELIAKNWNIVAGSSYCNAFTAENNVNINKPVLEAAKGNSGTGYLSINSKTGSFANIRPNIVLSNGLRLWILGDKAASVPGLSYNPVGITSTQNMCRELLKASNEPLSTKALCDAAGGYFCAGEAHCYTLDSESLGKMGDARNCCASTDLSTISHSENLTKDNRAFAVGGFTIFVDINGAAKGSSSLWEDVFPFYVGSNGRVYPGYPLDAPKAKDAVSNDVYLAGNSVKNIPVDVYYFETAGDDSRRRVVVYPNVSYARGVCYAKLIGSHTPYCKNLGLKAKGTGTDTSKITEMIDASSNPCTSHSCFVSVRNKLKFF